MTVLYYFILYFLYTFLPIITQITLYFQFKKNVTYALDKKITREATFDSADYRYGIMQNPNGEDAQNMGGKESGIKALYDAINNA